MPLSNSQYQAIMRIYNERQYEDKHAQDLRRAEVYAHVPRVKELEDAIASCAASCARLLLEGEEQGRQEKKAALAALRREKAELLREYGYEPDYMEMRYHCPDCRDTGYADGKKCHCFLKEQTKLLYAQSNIEEILKRENFGTFSFDVYDSREIIPELEMTVAEYMRQVLGWCREYVANFASKGGNLLFTGGTGVGKTFLTNCIAKELIDGGQSVICLSANDLVDVFSGGKIHADSEEELRDMYRYVLDCDLLIIDDLGTELNNSFVSSQLFYCLNERLLRGKGTVISTNLSVSTLRDTYSDRVSSRITSAYTIIPLYGEDLRTRRQGKSCRPS